MVCIILMLQDYLPWFKIFLYLNNYNMFFIKIFIWRRIRIYRTRKNAEKSGGSAFIWQSFSHRCFLHSFYQELNLAKKSYNPASALVLSWFCTREERVNSFKCYFTIAVAFRLSPSPKAFQFFSIYFSSFSSPFYDLQNMSIYYIIYTYIYYFIKVVLLII